MDKKYHEELYEIIDELNANLEDIINEYEDSEMMEAIISQLNHKAQEFVYDFQQEIEKIELIETDQ